MDCVLLVRRAERRGGADGAEYVQLLLGDRTGSVPAVVWDAVSDVTRIVRPGRPVHITGRIGGSPRQLVVQALRAPAPGTCGTRTCTTARRARPSRWRRTCASSSPPCRTPHLGGLLDGFFGEGSRRGRATARRRPRSPSTRPTATACSSTRLTVAQARRARSARRSRAIDRDVAVTGALLHDIGKLEAYTADRRASTSPTRAASRARSRSATTACGARSRRSTGFPPRLAEALLHIILSHHGVARARLSRSCPAPARRRSCTSSTTSAAGSARSTGSRRSLAAGERWSAFDRALGGDRVLPTGAMSGPGGGCSLRRAAVVQATPAVAGRRSQTRLELRPRPARSRR